MSNIPRGTRDFLPFEQIQREILIEKIKRIFQKWGFDPIETPTFEYYKTLSGKYGEEGEKLIYKFTDLGGRELGLKYDLTVPLARFFADHQNEIVKPFKRYQIQPVFRAEKPQKGRYREFYQCDIDIVGSKNLISDATIILTIDNALKEIGLKNFTFKINHRNFFYSISKAFNIEGREIELARSIDKLEKIGVDGVKDELLKKGFEEIIVDKVLEFLTSNKTIEEVLKKLSDDYAKIAYLELSEIFKYLEMFNINFKFDISLARGLDYYTGMIFETELNDIKIGSIASGGRYDNLIEIFTKYSVPAVGGSIGIDRLLTALFELKFLNTKKTYSDVLIAFAEMEDNVIKYGFKILEIIQSLGYNVDLYCGNKDLRGQLGYAKDKGIDMVIIIGSEELKKGSVQLKILSKNEQKEVFLNELKECLNFK
ncbi:MAG: histidine--tRNA ligase [candidate division WOR-3 bacterium]